MTQPHTPDVLDHFVQRIMSIQPGSFNIVGSGMPGMGGSAAPLEGALNSGMDVTTMLQQKTYEFAIAVRTHKPKDEVLALAKQVEGFLLSDAVLDVLADHQSNDLIDELYESVQLA